jgi:low affinity Fe/Cu permease
MTRRVPDDAQPCVPRREKRLAPRVIFLEGESGLTESSGNQKTRPFSFSASFNTAAQWTSRQCGRASTFAVACALIVVWAVTGPIFQFSDTWQLVINTGTTIVTFLMVFLIQNTQNRDSAALHLKLDELIRVNEGARNKLLDLEDLTEAELEHLKGSFTRLAGNTADDTLLREAADDLDAAGAEIQEARDKVSAVADHKATKPDR